MTLARGTRLGPYEVTAQIGAGGMGEVYRARDTQLDRDVALKVLPDHFVSDPERIARFQREAKTLAALNHPNIGAIHGLQEADGITALVLELVEGPTLADRIAQGPIPVEETLPIAQQIAQALEAAHEQGIIHRDLKPANIKLRGDGTVKVLDFGLAKMYAPTQAGSLSESDRQTPGVNPANSPTITSPAATRMGTIIGTAAYMSPEQARGKPIDKRTDIWAFGCVLYEMLTGQRSFKGDDISDVLASILAREPDRAALPPATPPSIRRLLERCLNKDRHERLRDIGDARLEIRDAIAKRDTELIGGAVRGSPRQYVGFIATLAVMILIAAVAAAWIFRPLPSSSEVRLDINTPPTSAPESLAISPDGRSIAFVANDQGRLRLWLRALDSGEARPLTGTDGGRHPFWSPNSRSIGFFADNQLKRIDLDGGAVRTLTNVYRGTGGAWGRDGVMLFSSLGDPISRIAETGGEPVELSGLFQQGSNFSPVFLPDGRRFLYYVRGTPEARGVYVGQLDGTMLTSRLLDSDAGAVYAVGHLFFVRQRTLFAQAFDAEALRLTGDQFAVAQNAATCPCVSVSDAGAIAYRVTRPAVERRFTWFDRSGKEVSKVTEAGAMASPSLSFDGHRVVGYRGNPVDGNVDLWMLDIRRAAFTRLTSDVADEVAPVWSPNGDRIAFSSNRNGTHDVYQKSATAAGSEELLLSTKEEKTITDWSPDGRFLVFDSRDLNRRSDIWALPLNGDRKPFAVVQTNFEEMRAQFSPDGKWLAYQSDESGRHEIYVQPFPGPGTKSPISTSGGTQVRWRRDGKELFYIDLDGRLMAVAFQVAPNSQTPEVDKPVGLFVPPLGGLVQLADFRHQYVVAADGQRFLVATVGEGPTAPITIILNWRPRP